NAAADGLRRKASTLSSGASNDRHLSSGCDLSSLKFFLYSITSHDLGSNELWQIFCACLQRSKGRGILSRLQASPIAVDSVLCWLHAGRFGAAPSVFDGQSEIADRETRM